MADINFAVRAATAYAYKMANGAANPRTDNDTATFNYAAAIDNVAAIWVHVMSILNAGYTEPSTLFGSYNAFRQIIGRLARKMGQGGSTLVDAQAQLDRFTALALNNAALIEMGNSGPDAVPGLT